MADLKDSRIMQLIRADTNGQENRLLEEMQRLEKSPAGFCAVHIHLSRLQPSNRRPEYIRIAQRAFDTITLGHNCELFSLGNLDLFLTCPSNRIHDVDKQLDMIRLLFRADPLTDADGGDQIGFQTWYDLEEELEYFKEDVVNLILLSKRENIRKEEAGENREKLSPKNLDQIAKLFSRVDASPLIRHQSAIQIGTGGQGQLLFREYYISINDLRKTIAPNVDIHADRWLFQYLTSILDQRVLLSLRSQSLDDLPKSISLNLNIHTVHSKDFRLFDKFVGNQAARFIFEFQPMDIFQNVEAYEEVRDFLQGRGYRVLVDSLQPLVLDYFDPSLLKADFYKIAWGDRLGDSATSEGAAEMRELIQSIGREKVIVSLVDSEEAIRFGLVLGVQRFQGFFIDRLVEAMQAKVARGA